MGCCNRAILTFFSDPFYTAPGSITAAGGAPASTPGRRRDPWARPVDSEEFAQHSSRARPTETASAASHPRWSTGRCSDYRRNILSESRCRTLHNVETTAPLVRRGAWCRQRASTMAPRHRLAAERSCGSTSVLSPAASSGANPHEALFSWVGIIMYMPPDKVGECTHVRVTAPSQLLTNPPSTLYTHCPLPSQHPPPSERRSDRWINRSISCTCASLRGLIPD